MSGPMITTQYACAQKKPHSPDFFHAKMPKFDPADRTKTTPGAMTSAFHTHLHNDEENDWDGPHKVPSLPMWDALQLIIHNTKDIAVEEGYSDSLSQSSSTISSSVPTTPLHTPGSSLSGASKLGSVVKGQDPDKNRPLPSLQTRLFAILQKIPGHPERKGFFPQSAFTDIVTEETVVGELQRCRHRWDITTIQQLAHKICGPKAFRRIFTLLMLVDKLVDIELFIEEDVSDGDLPLRKAPYEDSNLFQICRNEDTDEPLTSLSCFKSWDTVAVWSFEEWQWTTLAPFFESGKNKDVKHFILPEQVPLPFTQDTLYGVDFKAIQGGFSTVSTVHIHPDHHNFTESMTFASDFAVKRLNTQDRAQFKREVDMLMTFSGNAHPHLISLLATYEQFSRFYLVFPLAKADLQSYWKNRKPNPSMDHDTVLWVARQCHGISHGLSKIHRHNTVNFNRLNYEDFQQITDASGSHRSNGNGHLWQLQLFGRHGDIKPQNILWFQDPHNNADRGTLKITDFGLSEFRTSAKNVYKPSNLTAVSRPYRSPECDIIGGNVGQSHDIWALGCLYLEFITWLLGGWTLVDEFKKDRIKSCPTDYYDRITDGVFFDIQGNGGDPGTPVVKPAVSKWINKLRLHKCCSSYVSEFLDIIQMDLLVAKASSPQERGRIGVRELACKMKQLHKQCSDIEFATKLLPI